MPGGIASVAQAIGIAVVPDQARFAAELARVLYDPQERTSADSKFRRFIAYLKTAERSESTSNGGGRRRRGAGRTCARSRFRRRSARASGAPFRRRVYSAHSCPTRPRRPLCTALQRSTMRRWGSSRIIRRSSGMYEDGASAFAAFAAHLAVHDNRVTPPGRRPGSAPVGGAARREDHTARPVHSAVVHARRGRLAYLYDAIGSVDAPRAAFALGLWIPDARVRLDRSRRSLRVCPPSLPSGQSRGSPSGGPHTISRRCFCVFT